MKIIEKTTGKTVAEILGGENLTLDQALDLIGAVSVDDMDGDLYSNDGDNIITADGKRWCYEDLMWLPDELADRQVEAIELAKEIRESDEWDGDKLARLCELANLSEEWEAADGETFESVAYEAAEKLGVEI